MSSLEREIERLEIARRMASEKAAAYRDRMLENARALDTAKADLAASRRESAALGAMVARLRSTIESIHAGSGEADWIYKACDRAIALTPATAGAEYQALVDLAKRLCCDIANDAHCLDSGSLRADVIIYRSYGYARELADATKFDGPKTLHEFEAAARAVLDRAPGKEKR